MTEATTDTPARQAVISLSGGMDSASLLLKLLSHGCRVTAISFDYGQKHHIELERAHSLCHYLMNRDLALSHRCITLDGLAELLHSHLVSGGGDIPYGHYQQENMKQTVVPNRNKIFSSLIQAVALSLAQAERCPVSIAMGIHAGDHAIYPDCRPEFRNLDDQAFRSGNWGTGQVSLYTPFLHCDKTTILKDGIQACHSLGLPVQEVYQRTLTAYDPHYHNGEWLSDYQSAASIERIEAFMNAGVADPITYGDANGPVDWETACAHARSVLYNE